MGSVLCGTWLVFNMIQFIVFCDKMGSVLCDTMGSVFCGTMGSVLCGTMGGVLYETWVLCLNVVHG